VYSITQLRTQSITHTAYLMPRDKIMLKTGNVNRYLHVDAAQEAKHVLEDQEV